MYDPILKFPLYDIKVGVCCATGGRRVMGFAL